MEQSSSLKPQLDCPLTHELINKLSVVIGNCDLLFERAPEDWPLLKHLSIIRNTAKAMAADLADFQCEVVRLRIANPQKEEATAVDAEDGSRRIRRA